MREALENFEEFIEEEDLITEDSRPCDKEKC